MNITWHSTKIIRDDREKNNGHKGACIWFTGLSGSGKSTLANEVEAALFAGGAHTYLLDGDNIRHGLNVNLDFSEEGRRENIRRIGEVARLFMDAGIIVLSAFISPFLRDRENVRKLFDPGRFIEIFVDCDLATCEARDPKGLYKKARNGEIPDFTGISSPYEEPPNPEIRIFNGAGTCLEENVAIIMQCLDDAGIVARHENTLWVQKAK